MQSFEAAERAGYFQQFGSHCPAHATLQPGMRYFDLPGVGYLAYMRSFGTRFVLSEPVCPPDQCAALIGKALEEHPKTCFVQMHEAGAQMLRERGFYTTAMGVEIIVDLPGYGVGGRAKRRLREGINRVEDGGLVIRELDGDCSAHEALAEVSNGWLKRKATRSELRFLTPPANFGAEAGVRKFVVYDPVGTPLGFVFFAPIYRDGQVVGYVSDVNRAAEKVPGGLDYAITAHAIGVFQSEGAQTLSLGLCPLVGVTDQHHTGNNRLTSLAAKLLSGFLNDLVKRIRGRPLYSFAGLYYHKAQYRGREEPVFFCSKSLCQWWEIIRVLRLCNVV
jgi:lysylphosphatidylglycerol synthetase-like protein (DUF2156 family)